MWGISAGPRECMILHRGQTNSSWAALYLLVFTHFALAVKHWQKAGHVFRFGGKELERFLQIKLLSFNSNSRYTYSISRNKILSNNQHLLGYM